MCSKKRLIDLILGVLKGYEGREQMRELRIVIAGDMSCRMTVRNRSLSELHDCEYDSDCISVVIGASSGSVFHIPREACSANPMDEIRDLLLESQESKGVNDLFSNELKRELGVISPMLKTVSFANEENT